MATTTIRLCVPDASPAAQKLLEVLAALGVEVISEEEEFRTEAPCSVCGHLFDVAALEQGLDWTPGPACSICVEVARRVLDEWHSAANRGLRELRDQLPRVIRDIRAGAAVPSFYRGFE